MKFEEFNRKWVEAFGSPLTMRNGAVSWQDFVEDDNRSDGLLVLVLNDFSEQYNALTAAMSPHAKDAVPTLKAFKDRYFGKIRDRKAENFRPSDCPVCGGRGIVYALAPAIGDLDRQLAPEDWRTISANRVYPFAEVYNCPECRRNAKIYEGRDSLRQRVRDNCVPEVVREDDPRNVYGCAIGGDAFIRWELSRRFSAEVAG